MQYNMNMTANTSGSFSSAASGLPASVASSANSVTASQILLLAFLGYVAFNRYEYWKKTPAVLGVGFVPIPFLGSWIAAIRFLLRPLEMVNEGFAKSKNGMFRISTIQGEYVLVADRHKVAEYLKAPDSILHMQDGANDQQQIPWTMGYGVGHRTYHVSVVRGPITQSIVPWTPIMVEEAALAFDELIGNPDQEQPIPLYDTIAMTVGRIANRVYVGTEFCRNKEYLQNAADYAQAVVISSELLRMFPNWVKHILVRFMPVMAHRRKGEKFLRKYIEDRLEGRAVGENGGKPTDLVQRLIEAAPPIEKTVPQLAERVMALNVASIHTTTMTFTSALYSLAAEPEKYAEVLRSEVLENLVNGQITAETLQRLPKMESFLRESARFNGAGLMAMQRNARKEFKFSDGTVIPAGAKVGAVSRILQRDPEVFENPDVFDGFRFYQPDSDARPLTILNTGANFTLFGHGRHPCPGRFIAAHEMKIMFAILLLRYNFRLAEGTKPEPFFIATMCIADTKLKVLFKARK